MEAPTYPFTIVAPHNKMPGILAAHHVAAHPALSTDHFEGTPYLAVHKREALDAYEYIQIQLHTPGGGISSATYRVVVTWFDEITAVDIVSTNPATDPVSVQLGILSDQLAAIDARLKHNIALLARSEQTCRNSHYLRTMQCDMAAFPVKTVNGYGNLPQPANPLFPIPAGAPDALIETLPVFLGNPIPSPLNEGFDARQLAALRAFYNETFGFVAGDSLKTQNRKLKSWAVGLEPRSM